MSPKSKGRPPGRGRHRPSPSRPARQLTQLDHVLRDTLTLAQRGRTEAQLVASAWLGQAWTARQMGDRGAERELVTARATPHLAGRVDGRPTRGHGTAMT